MSAARHLPITQSRDPIADFLHYCEVEKGLAATTVKQYGSTLAGFAALMSRGQLVHASREHVRRYLAEYGRTAGPRSQANAVAVLRQFFKFLLIDGLRRDNPMLRVDAPQFERRLMVPPSQAEMHHLLDLIPGNSPLSLRDKAMCELFYGSGIRASELVTARLSDLELKDGTLMVHGKGDKERIVPVGGRAALALTLYLQNGRPCMWLDAALVKELQRDGLSWRQMAADLGVGIGVVRGVLRRKDARSVPDVLFVDRNGSAITRQGAWQALQRVCRAAGVPGMGPHSLRRALGTHMLENGADLRTIQTILGHSDIQTTCLYAKLSAKHLRKSLMEHHPRESRSRPYARRRLEMALFPPAPLKGWAKCAQCGDPAHPGATLCAKHVELSRQAAKRYREKRRAGV